MIFAGLNVFTPLWIGWGVMFLIIEFTALWGQHSGRTKGNGTLSALVWRATDARYHPVGRWLFFIAWLTLTSHFFIGIP